MFKQENAASIFKQSNQYFLLITRKNIDYLPISVENIFHLKNEGIKHFLSMRILHTQKYYKALFSEK